MFLDPGQFEFVAALEAQWEAIRAEYLALPKSENDGYKIVFSEERAMFGLASVGFASDQHPVICGYHGDFPTKLASM